jgi:hypothetical protein
MRLEQMLWLSDNVLAQGGPRNDADLARRRAPFLQCEVAEFAARLPVELHLSKGGQADVLWPLFALGCLVRDDDGSAMSSMRAWSSVPTSLPRPAGSSCLRTGW